MYMQTQLRIMKRPRSRRARRRQARHGPVAEFNGQGPKPTQLASTIALVKYYAAWPYRLITSTQADAPATATLLDPSKPRGIPTC